MAQVELQSGPHRVVSLMQGADELGLGRRGGAVAAVKSTTSSSRSRRPADVCVAAVAPAAPRRIAYVALVASRSRCAGRLRRWFRRRPPARPVRREDRRAGGLVAHRVLHGAGEGVRGRHPGTTVSFSFAASPSWPPRSSRARAGRVRIRQPRRWRRSPTAATRPASRSRSPATLEIAVPAGNPAGHRAGGLRQEGPDHRPVRSGGPVRRRGRQGLRGGQGDARTGHAGGRREATLAKVTSARSTRPWSTRPTSSRRATRSRASTSQEVRRQRLPDRRAEGRGPGATAQRVVVDSDRAFEALRHD